MLVVAVQYGPRPVEQVELFDGVGPVPGAAVTERPPLGYRSAAERVRNLMLSLPIVGPDLPEANGAVEARIRGRNAGVVVDVDGLVEAAVVIVTADRGVHRGDGRSPSVRRPVRPLNVIHDRSAIRGSSSCTARRNRLTLPPIARHLDRLRSHVLTNDNMLVPPHSCFLSRNHASDGLRMPLPRPSTNTCGPALCALVAPTGRSLATPWETSFGSARGWA
jgi:hypothetical protein